MGVDANRSDDTLSREISCRNAARTIRGGEISPLRSASVEMTEGVGRLFCHLGREISPLRFAPVEMTGMGAVFYNLRPLKGKRLTTFCASLALLHPLLSLTHWIFRSLMLPYKSSSHSAKCVRCAPKGATITLGPKGRRLLSEANITLLHNPRRQPRPFF